jgi:hypothetical protein
MIIPWKMMLFFEVSKVKRKIDRWTGSPAEKPAAMDWQNMLKSPSSFLGNRYP